MNGCEEPGAAVPQRRRVRDGTWLVPVPGAARAHGRAKGRGPRPRSDLICPGVGSAALLRSKLLPSRDWLQPLAGFGGGAEGLGGGPRAGGGSQPLPAQQVRGRGGGERAGRGRAGPQSPSRRRQRPALPRRASAGRGVGFSSCPFSRADAEAPLKGLGVELPGW